jgi:hypothetical protein
MPKDVQQKMRAIALAQKAAGDLAGQSLEAIF